MDYCKAYKPLYNFREGVGDTSHSCGLPKGHTGPHKCQSCSRTWLDEAAEATVND